MLAATSSETCDIGGRQRQEGEVTSVKTKVDTQSAVKNGFVRPVAVASIFRPAVGEDAASKKPLFPEKRRFSALIGDFTTCSDPKLAVSNEEFARRRQSWDTRTAAPFGQNLLRKTPNKVSNPDVILKEKKPAAVTHDKVNGCVSENDIKLNSDESVVAKKESLKSDSVTAISTPKKLENDVDAAKEVKPPDKKYNLSLRRPSGKTPLDTIEDTPIDDLTTVEFSSPSNTTVTKIGTKSTLHALPRESKAKTTFCSDSTESFEVVKITSVTCVSSSKENSSVSNNISNCGSISQSDTSVIIGPTVKAKPKVYGVTQHRSDTSNNLSTKANSEVNKPISSSESSCGKTISTTVSRISPQKVTPVAPKNSVVYGLGKKEVNKRSEVTTNKAFESKTQELSAPAISTNHAVIEPVKDSTDLKSLGTTNVLISDHTNTSATNYNDVSGSKISTAPSKDTSVQRRKRLTTVHKSDVSNQTDVGDKLAQAATNTIENSTSASTLQNYPMKTKDNINPVPNTNDESVRVTSDAKSLSSDAKEISKKQSNSDKTENLTETSSDNRSQVTKGVTLRTSIENKVEDLPKNVRLARRTSDLIANKIQSIFSKVGPEKDSQKAVPKSKADSSVKKETVVNETLTTSIQGIKDPKLAPEANETSGLLSKNEPGVKLSPKTPLRKSDDVEITTSRTVQPKDLAFSISSVDMKVDESSKGVECRENTKSPEVKKSSTACSFNLNAEIVNKATASGSNVNTESKPVDKLKDQSITTNEHNIKKTLLGAEKDSKMSPETKPTSEKQTDLNPTTSKTLNSGKNTSALKNFFFPGKGQSTTELVSPRIPKPYVENPPCKQTEIIEPPPLPQAIKKVAAKSAESIASVNDLELKSTGIVVSPHRHAASFNDDQPSVVMRTKLSNSSAINTIDSDTDDVIMRPPASSSSFGQNKRYGFIADESKNVTCSSPISDSDRLSFYMRSRPVDSNGNDSSSWRNSNISMTSSSSSITSLLSNTDSSSGIKDTRSLTLPATSPYTPPPRPPERRRLKDFSVPPPIPPHSSTITRTSSLKRFEDSKLSADKSLAILRSPSHSCVPTYNPHRFSYTEMLSKVCSYGIAPSSSTSSLPGRYKKYNSASLSQVSELWSDLTQEQSSSAHASEILEAETSERMRLEKEVQDLQSRYSHVQQKSDKMELEMMEAHVYRSSEVNGGLSEDEDGEGNNSIYKQKYERAVRDMEMMKRRIQQQHEEIMEQNLLNKKAADKKLAEALEDVEEERQVASQWKRKTQKLSSELQDLRIMLEEQTARNGELEKKQRRFDTELSNGLEELKKERTAREKMARERDQAFHEKYSLEQELHSTRLDMDLQHEKITQLNREIDELALSSKGEEEVTQLKRCKQELERKSRDQEEELEELAGQVQMLEQAKLRLEMSLEKLRQEHRRESSVREEEIEELRASFSKKIKNLEAQLESEQEERHQMVKQKHELERRLIELSDQPPTQDPEIERRLRRDLKRTKALLRDAQSMLEHVRDGQGNKSIIRQLKNQLEDSEFAKCAAIKAKQTAEMELQEHQLQLEEITRTKNDFETKCLQLSREKSTIQTQLEEMEEEMSEVMKKYKASVAQMGIEQKTIAEQNQQITELEMERHALKEQLSEVSSKFEHLAGQSEDTSRVYKLDARVRDLESKLELEQTTRGRLEHQISRLKEQIDRMQEDCDSLRNKELQAQEGIRRFQRQIRDLREDYAALQQKEAEAYRKQHDLEHELENSEGDLKVTKNDLRLACQRIEELKNALEDDLDSGTDVPDDSGSDTDSSLDMSMLRHSMTPIQRCDSASSSLSYDSRRSRTPSLGPDFSAICSRGDAETEINGFSHLGDSKNNLGSPLGQENLDL